MMYNAVERNDDDTGFSNSTSFTVLSIDMEGMERSSDPLETKK